MRSMVPVAVSIYPLARKTAKRMGFRDLCMSENPQADRANFRMIYEQLAEREKKDMQLPVGLLEQIGRTRAELIEAKEGA